MKLVLELKKNQMITTGQVEGGHVFPCLDQPMEDAADKLVRDVVVKKQNSPCG
jgi:hypothetical protein